MAMFFAQRVILGKTAYADVPAVLKPQVQELLEDSGLGELVTEGVHRGRGNPPQAVRR